MARSVVLFLILLMNVGFIAFGVAVTLFVLNEWDLDERLNALFGGFLGALFFMLAWKAARRWARGRLKLSESR